MKPGATTHDDGLHGCLLQSIALLVRLGGRLGQRQAATDQTRARIIGAARELLTASSGFRSFSLDAVARQAGVARVTVYYQFHSKGGLLEAIFDDLAYRGQMERLAAAFARPEPLETLAEFISTFGRFWGSDRLVIRRLRHVAVLDRDLEEGLRARDERRRVGLRVILQRILERHRRPEQEKLDEAVDILFTLTSFETFDTLAGATRTPEDVVPVLWRIAGATLGLDVRPATR